MTTTPADQGRTADTGPGHGERTRPDHPQDDTPASTPDPPGSSRGESRLGELLAPFVAWLATQDLEELERRRHREAAERFLRWSHTDTGPAVDRRRRYERHLQRHDPDHREEARAGLDWWAHHRRILATTLPVHD